MSVSRRRVRAIFRKELREYRRNRTIVTGMAILPLLFLAQPLVAVLNLGASADNLSANKTPVIPPLGEAGQRGTVLHPCLL